MLPFLLMILHFSQIGFTDDLTFMSNPPSLLCSAYNFRYFWAHHPKNDHFIVYHLSIDKVNLFFILFISPDNASFAQVIRGHLKSNFIPRQNLDKVHAELS